MFDEYFDQSTYSEPVPTATVVNAPIVSTNTSVSTTIAQDAPSTSYSLSSSQVHPLVFFQGVAADPTIEDVSLAEPTSESTTSHLSNGPRITILIILVGNPSRPVSTSKTVSIRSFVVLFHNELSKSNPKNFKWRDRRLLGFKPCKMKFNEFDDLKYGNSTRPISVELQRDTSVEDGCQTAFLNVICKNEVFVSQPEDCGIMRMSGFEEESSGSAPVSWKIDWLAGHQRCKEAVHLKTRGEYVGPYKQDHECA
ncbi:hypothetical protein Tco_0693176 [Tanacetum coccineum]